MRLARAFLSLSLLQIPKASSSFAIPSHRAASASASASSFMSRNIHNTKLYSTSTEKLNIFGGDYAGHSATFSSIDGALIPVPNHYVPEAMVEWGQVPNGLESIVSEDLVQNENENENENDNENENENENESDNNNENENDNNENNE
eukprot:793624_1